MRISVKGMQRRGENGNWRTPAGQDGATRLLGAASYAMLGPSQDAKDVRSTPRGGQRACGRSGSRRARRRQATRGLTSDEKHLQHRLSRRTRRAALPTRARLLSGPTAFRQGGGVRHPKRGGRRSAAQFRGPAIFRTIVPAMQRGQWDMVASVSEQEVAWRRGGTVRTCGGPLLDGLDPAVVFGAPARAGSPLVRQRARQDHRQTDAQG